MTLSKITKKNLEREKQIHHKIYRNIDNFNNLIFNAGAGSGKTYALVESLKYIMSNYNKRLEYHNQKIMCITYTNIAKNEIIERLGNSDIIEISTIHDRLWEIIKKFQDELVDIHFEKINIEMKKINNSIENGSKFTRYNRLSKSEKEELIELIIDNKDIFWENYDKKAKPFRKKMIRFFDNFNDILGNVNKFKKLATKIIRLHRYRNILNYIEEKKDGYRSIKYDYRINYDRLHMMMISHDTLLEYSFKMIQKFDLLKKIIINRYPYILIDEFQDTNEKVIRFMQELYLYSVRTDYKFFIGYFGDVAQNIYDDGVGSKIFDVHNDFITINKKFNRRSTIEIIQLINKIRNDGVDQKSIYSDSKGGTVEFVVHPDADINSYIDYYKKEWNISKDNKLNCLVLTNKILAKYIGASNIYKYFKNTKYYKKNYEQLSTELLSNNLNKLGSIPKLFFNIIDFEQSINEPNTLIKEIFNNKNNFELKYDKIIEFKKIIDTLRGDTLFQFLKKILDNYAEANNQYYKEAIEDLFGIDNEYLSTANFIQYLIDELYFGDPEQYDEAYENLQNLINIEMSEYINWINYIKSDNKKPVQFHTYHGTKGSEYMNVLIFMKNDFGIDRNKFPNYFKNINNFEELNERKKGKFINTQNLLYVSCSRAIKNLTIIYLDKIDDFEEGIQSIFGETINFISDE